jgi:AraC-like DNA-binding protein
MFRACCRSGAGSGSLHDMANLLTFASIRQTRSGQFRQLAIAQPVLIVVGSGQKTIEVEGRRLVAVPGEGIALSGGLVATVRNEAPAGAAYEADVYALAHSVPLLPQDGGFGHEAHGAFVVPPAMRTHLHRLRDEAPELPDAILGHRARELALWLTSFGIAWRHRDRSDLPFLIRDLVAQEPAGKWSVARLLPLLAKRGHALSEASLRRRLAAQGTSFTALVIDTRLSLALERLQSSDDAITRIALDVGYESSSRFAVRFRSRFGMCPSDIRGHNRRPDRIGTKIERAGAALPAAE